LAQNDSRNSVPSIPDFVGTTGGLTIWRLDTLADAEMELSSAAPQKRRSSVIRFSLFGSDL
jgi:hypothetical protein